MCRLETPPGRAAHNPVSRPRGVRLRTDYRSARVDGEDRFATDDTLRPLARRSGLEQSTLVARPVQEITMIERDHAAARGMADRGPCATARGGDPNLSQGTG
jgi:hypothetical protein